VQSGSLPRPSWYTENLGTKSFLDAMVISRFREQYVDALSAYLREQEVAGLDIVTDGDCRFDQDVGGQRWTSYPPHHIAGFEQSHPKLARAGAGGIAFPRGHILHDYLEARVMPKIIGPVGRGEMQYAEIWKAAQRLTGRPVKFGTVTPELVAFAVQDEHYKDVPSRIMALSDAFVQQHGERAAGESGGVVPHLLGKSVPAADVRQGAILQTRTRCVESGRRRRDHLRDEELERDGPRRRWRTHYGQEGGHRRHHHTLQVTNIVRKELGLPVAESTAADPKLSLVRSRAAAVQRSPRRASCAAG
jgi:hypothetical protein